MRSSIYPRWGGRGLAGGGRKGEVEEGDGEEREGGGGERRAWRGNGR